MRREKLFIVFALLYSVLCTSHHVDGASIIKYENEPNTGNGLYKFSYETSNGISRSEHSEIKTDKDNKEYIIVIGEYQYFDIDGIVHSVTYTSDEKGYKQIDKILRQEPVSYISSAALGSLIGGGLG